MRDQWYGDNRDLVKWGILLQLAAIHGAKKIIQVAYFRPSGWDVLDIDGVSYRLPEAVIEHFRNCRNISKLTKDPEIQVVASTFSDRAAYEKKVIEIVAEVYEMPRIVFLDPDTGLAPRNPSLAHVLDNELARIWKSLHAGDVLVFYQHANRNTTPWVSAKQEQFEHAIGIAHGSAKLARAQKIAQDVVFFYARKDNASTNGPA